MEIWSRHVKVVEAAGSAGALRRRLMVAATSAIGAAFLGPWYARGRGSSQTEVRLSLPGPGDSVSLPLQLALKLGADRDEGIALRLKFVGGGGVALQDLAAGNAHYGVLGLPAAMNSHLKDARVVALAAVHDLPLYVLMVRNDLRGRVKRVEDLKGRVIGVHSGSLATRTTAHLLTEMVLRSHGLSVEDVRFVAAGQNWDTQSSALGSGVVDATMTDEPFATRLAAEKIAFQLYATGYPDDAARTPGAGFLRAALIGRKDRVDADPATAERMTRLIKRVLQWMATHSPEQWADALGIKAGAERDSLVSVARKYPRQYSRDGRFSTAQLRETEVFFRASNPDNLQAQGLAVETMIIDRWAGRKP